VFLKSLTLRGFKSFADKTELAFQPGVTVVVGPNGSGKSNLVDAVAWVLGAQGPRSLRGAKMDDVIFAGTPDRPALGRAEVSLTIDNAAGLLPIEFSEVTITRTLFRAGDSEYQINGAPCRLLDIQELLSDSGIGRQQHVIVGQGQLDAVLNARPEDRRAIVEEAAGILKFRKRRERAERRLEATEGSLLRLNDLLREVRRQLTPLQRQADAARRHGGLVEELRAIRLHLAGHEIAGLQANGERLRDRATELGRNQRSVEARLRDLDLAVLDAEASLTAVGHGDVADALGRAEALRERTAGLDALLHEKRRSLEREAAAVADEGVFETLVADAAHVREQLTQVQRELDAVHRDRAEIEGAEQELEGKRALLDVADTPDAAHDEAQLVRRELETRREALARGEAEVARAAARVAIAADRVERLGTERMRLEVEEARAREQAPVLVAAAGVARDALVAAEQAAVAAGEAWRVAEADAGRWHARADALEQALDTARVASAAAELDGVPGVVGPLVEHLHIESGAEVAVHAMLGDALHAVVVDGPEAARRAVARLAAGDARALVVIADRHAIGKEASGESSAPAGTRFLAGLVRSNFPGLQVAVRRMLGDAVLSSTGWAAALDLALDHPQVTVVTSAGDRFGGGRPWRLGGEDSGVTQSALQEAQQRARDVAAATASLEQDLRTARAALEEGRADEAQAREAARVGESALDDHHRALERVAAELEERVVEAEAATADELALRQQHSHDATAVAELSDRLPLLEAAALEARTLFETYADARRDFEGNLGTLASRRGRLDVRAAQVEERREVLERRLAEVEARLERDPERRAQAEQHRATLEQRAHGYAIVADHLGALLDRVDALLARWRIARRVEAERAAAAGRRLDELRRVRIDAERELVEIREHAQRRDVDEAETRLRLETAIDRLRAEFDVEPARALDAPAPEVPGGTTLAGRARELERELRLMGPINPLALEEHDALLERHEFLQGQLEDVKASRRELSRVIRAVDGEIVTLFSGAFDDVSNNFADLFSTLFPGGAGRLLLTDPDDLLNTGIEMDARPSGKSVRRLSLLSGGERSLTALAFLFAVFRARPSPFYLMDEVEAALDDVNLHRFLDLVHEFRDEAQLLIVSHQKRTMEAGDCLYGVSMPPGGSSRVVSQRVNDDLPVA
jgi:chromosome segregation protein